MSNMNTLRNYLSHHWGATNALADQLKVAAATVSQWAHDVRQVPVERCIEIERATDGAVRCEDLRPDIDWEVLRNRTA